MTESKGKKYARVVFEEEIPENATEEEIVDIMGHHIINTDVGIDDIEIHNRPYIQDECNSDAMKEKKE